MVLGEARFHTCLEAEAWGIGLLLPGHFASERFAVEELAGLLGRQFPEVQVWASRQERDPLRGGSDCVTGIRAADDDRRCAPFLPSLAGPVKLHMKHESSRPCQSTTKSTMFLLSWMKCFGIAARCSSSTTARATARPRSWPPARRARRTHAQNRGYGAALQSAFDFALRDDYDVLVTIDCDGQHQPCMIPD